MKINFFYVGNPCKAINRVAIETHKKLTLSSLAVAPVANSSSGSFVEVINAVLGIADWLCVGVIMFSGASWMFGNRTKAIELLIGGASGYLIIRKAQTIQLFLKGL